MKKTRIDIAEDLKKRFPELSESNQIRPLLNSMIDLFKCYLKDGHSVHFARFGTLEIRDHAASCFVSNLSGFVVEVPHRRIAKFRISRKFRNELNGGKNDD